MMKVLTTTLALMLTGCGGGSTIPGNSDASTQGDGAITNAGDGAIATETAEGGGSCTGDSVTEACFVCLSSSCCTDLKACLADSSAAGCKTQFLYFEACQTSHLTGCWSSVTTTNPSFASCASAHCASVCHD